MIKFDCSRSVMDSATEEIYFQRLQEYVQDDDKSVTIPALARDLKISIGDSKYLLSKYVKDQRKLNPSQLAVTYVLTGTLQGKGDAVVIVKETDLEEKRSLFDKIESETLFSVQKCKDIDFTSLSLVYDVTQAAESPLLGSIVNKHCIKRTLKVKKLPPPPPSTIKGKSSFFLPKTSSTSSIKSEDSSKDESKQNNQEKGDKKPTPNNKPKGGLSAFFSKSSSTSSIKSENGIKKEISTTSSSQPSELEELMEVDFQEIDEEFKADSKKIKIEPKVDIKEQQSEVASKKTSKEVSKEDKKNTVKKSDVKEKRNKNKREREKSQEKTVKKRKRIVERNDSESDDMFENDEEDVVEKSDEEPERAASPPAKKPLAPKNKIRKAVDKTYMDEEGYMVTKTEYVYESAPEDDEPPKALKKEPAEKPKMEKKNSVSSENDGSPQKGGRGKKGKKNNMQNQPTLMNFFKKK